MYPQDPSVQNCTMMGCCMQAGCESSPLPSLCVVCLARRKAHGLKAGWRVRSVVSSLSFVPFFFPVGADSEWYPTLLYSFPYWFL